MSLKRLTARMPRLKPKRGTKNTTPSAPTPAAASSRKLPEWGQLRGLPPSKTVVVQPKNAYPRFAFRFYFRRPDGKREIMAAAAYTTELAEAQARSLASIFGWTFIKVRKLSRINWSAYYKPDSANSASWMARAVAAWNKRA